MNEWRNQWFVELVHGFVFVGRAVAGTFFQVNTVNTKWQFHLTNGSLFSGIAFWLLINVTLLLLNNIQSRPLLSEMQFSDRWLFFAHVSSFISTKLWPDDSACGWSWWRTYCIKRVCWVVYEIPSLITSHWHETKHCLHPFDIEERERKRNLYLTTLWTQV